MYIRREVSKQAFARLPATEPVPPLAPSDAIYRQAVEMLQRRPSPHLWAVLGHINA